MAPPPPPPDPAVLLDELVEDILLRLPPEDPAVLARAALISTQWHRVVTGLSFRRRFRELHRSSPPLLGYILSFADSVRFVPLSSFRPPCTERRGVRAVSANHGRVLLHRLSATGSGGSAGRARGLNDLVDVHLSVWHPVTDEQQDLPVVPRRPNRIHGMDNWDAAVVCAGGDGCDHLDCHFKVVFVGNRVLSNFSCVYSSEAGSWSDPVFSSEEVSNYFVPGNFVLIGTALYNTSAALYNTPTTNVVFKYDLQTHQMCNISIAPAFIGLGSMLIPAEDGKLGFAMAGNSTLGLWVMENGRFGKSRTIDLRTLLTAYAMRHLLLRPCPVPVEARPWVTAFGATGAGVIFLRTPTGYFTIDLKSESCKRVGEASSGRVVPYVSFCTPAPVADAIRETNVEDSHPDLYDAIMFMPGFTDGALLSAYGHLLDNKAQGCAFVEMNASHRARWLKTFLAKHYYV